MWVNLRNVGDNLFGKCTNTLDVPGSVHRNIKIIERTNKIQPCGRIYCFNVS